MTIADFKRQMNPGRLVRKVWDSHGACDQMRCVSRVDTVQFWMIGETYPGLTHGEAFTPWPKKGELIEEENGFAIQWRSHKEVSMRFRWVGDGAETPKDAAVVFLLNTWEHCESTDEAILFLGDRVGHRAATAIMEAWNALPVERRIALERPEPCDASLREWLGHLMEFDDIHSALIE